MGRRRFAPLIVVVLIGALVLIARLFTLQVLERDLWTAQADALVREGSIDPYTRGEILDRRGRVLARDIESYRVDAVYRDFRRRNALGIVAHARSALELRPVPLSDARADLLSWAVALGRLAPADLDVFAGGGVLECAGVRTGSTTAPEGESRAARALDLRFYTAAIFELTASERSRLKRLADEERAIAFVDWIARERKTTRAALEAALIQRCQYDLQFLADFAELWAAGRLKEGESALPQLLVQLENWRSDVEDGAASDMFEAATGFPAGRIEAECVSEFIDLDWIRRSLNWDETRLSSWIHGARTTWLALRDGPLLDFAVERVRRNASTGSPAPLVLREVVSLFVESEQSRRDVFAEEQPWFERGPTQVLGELGSLFDAEIPDDLDRDARLPIFDPEFVRSVQQNPDDPASLALLEFWRGDGEPMEPTLIEDAARHWRARFDGRPGRSELRRGLESVFARLEEDFQAEVRERIESAFEYARENDDLTLRGKLPIAKARLDRGEERVRYILKDRGSRHFTAVSRPSYDLVNLLTRYPQHLRGFEVRRVHLRVNPTQDAQQRAIARQLVGKLTAPSVARRLSQADLARHIAMLASQSDRDEATEALLLELRASLDRPEEQVGSSGLESWLDAELSGRNGLREERGLAERKSGERQRPTVEKIDGLSVVTTLDALLQQEAEYCLEHPDGDLSRPDKSDKAWLDNPTGAIVLLSLEGDILVAASVPMEARPEVPGRNPISDDVRERTLTKPDFQPPGSVFKVFVAAYALDHLGLDPKLQRECSAAMNPGGRGPGYNGVHCHETQWGHGSLDLRRALSVSCNSYFAWLGEQYDVVSLGAMAHEFGFGEPTGVRSLDDGSRSGLAEDFVPDLFRSVGMDSRTRSQAGNGLTAVEATPMQVARATVGLATGVLPTVRLVSRIGDRELPRDGRRLELSAGALSTVRNAMLAVTADSDGSAHSALSPQQLGFSMAAKTGSADVTSVAVEDKRVLKHTWVAGWFPAENPVAILVVFEHRTTQTSSHSAIWLARQFLKRPAVSAWVAEQMGQR